jgi:hypothetical protein
MINDLMEFGGKIGNPFIKDGKRFHSSLKTENALIRLGLEIMK